MMLTERTQVMDEGGQGEDGALGEGLTYERNRVRRCRHDFSHQQHEDGQRQQHCDTCTDTTQTFTPSQALRLLFITVWSRVNTSCYTCELDALSSVNSCWAQDCSEQERWRMKDVHSEMEGWIPGRITVMWNCVVLPDPDRQRAGRQSWTSADASHGLIISYYIILYYIILLFLLDLWIWSSSFCWPCWLVGWFVWSLLNPGGGRVSALSRTC